MNTLRALPIFFICLELFRIKALAQEFTAEGELTRRGFSGGVAKWTSKKTFSLKRVGDRWLIRTSDLAGIDDPNHTFLYEEIGSDGTNLFQLQVEDTYFKSWRALKSGDVPELDDPKLITVLGRVSDDSVPVGTDFVSPPPAGADAIWLAYAATPYFDGITNSRVRTLENVPEEFPQLQMVQADWQKDAAFPHLLQSVKYHNDGRTVAWLPDGKKGIETLPAPYDRGYVDAVYAAGEFTNIDSFHLPLRFSYTVYWPSFSASNQLVIAAIVEGKLTKFKAGVDNNSLYPRFIRKTLVADDRFAKDGVKDFNYTIEKDGGWWPTNHPKIDAYLKFYKKNYAKLLSKPKKQELK